ncbi:TPA: hypothetical protein ACH3X1_002322 [Trebouxia sp. C0004]
MQITPCQVSTLKHRGTTAFWGQQPAVIVLCDRSKKCSLLTQVSQCTCGYDGDVLTGSNRSYNVLQKGALCVRRLSWQHANYYRVSRGNQQTEATAKVAKRQITGQATHIPMAVSEDHHPSEAGSQLSMSIECLEWFAARKISPQTLFRNNLAERKVCMSSKQPDMELAIVHPSIYKGQIIGTKYRTLDRRWGQSKQFQTVWYGIDDIDGQNTVIIVEGNFLYTPATIPYILSQLELALQ